MSKNTRKELLNSPDEFMTTTAAVVKWIRENSKTFITTVTAVILVFGAVTGYYYWDKSREESAMVEYFLAANDAGLNDVVIQDYADTKAGKLAIIRSAQTAFKAGDYEKSLAEAIEFVDTWSSKDILYWEALLLIAASHMASNDSEKALENLEKATTPTTPDSIREQALFYKALILNDLGRTEDAQSAVLQIEGEYKNLARASLASLISDAGAADGK